MGTLISGNYSSSILQRIPCLKILLFVVCFLLLTTIVAIAALKESILNAFTLWILMRIWISTLSNNQSRVFPCIQHFPNAAIYLYIKDNSTQIYICCQDNEIQFIEWYSTDFFRSVDMMRDVLQALFRIREFK